jgi:hypothetical protein
MNIFRKYAPRIGKFASFRKPDPENWGGGIRGRGDIIENKS